MSLIRRASTVGGLTLVSRGFGFVRDAVMAAVLGAGPLADAFMVAFRLPNHFRAILAEGAFNSAFLPTYAAIAERQGAEEARRLRSAVLSWSLAANLALLALALSATGWLVGVLAAGFGDDPVRRDLAIELTRITFPYLACLSAVTLMSGVLNAHDRFVAAAAAPILLNLAMTGALLAAWLFPSAAHAAAWGVLAGGLAQLALLTAACLRAGLTYRIGLPRLDPAVRTFFRRFGPAVLGAGGVQIALFADTLIATFLPAGSISYLYYADRLYQLPLGVIGIAIGTALLPDLSRRLADPQDGSAPVTLGHAVAVAIVLAVPCAVGFAFAGGLIVDVLFGRGAFSAAAVSGSASALAAYAIGLPAAIALRGLVSGFHARGDTATPVKALAVSTLVNLVLKLVLIGPLAHAGLAAATAVGMWVYAVILAVLLRRKGHLAFPRRDRVRLAAVAAASLPAAAALLLWRDGLPFAAMLAPRWQAPATLAGLCVITLVIFAAALGLGEAWSRRRKRR